MSFYRVEIARETFYVSIAPGQKLWPVINAVCDQRKIGSPRSWLAHPLNRGDFPASERVFHLQEGSL
jgi:hypothetical protein